MPRNDSIRRRATLALVLVALAAPGRARASTPACADGEDNDLDALVDFPADPGCHAGNDGDEADAGAAPAVESRLLVVIAASGTLNGDLCAAGLFTGGDGSTECVGSDVSCTDCPSAACGNGLADDSRLFQITSGLGELALRGDLEVALARSDQGAVTFACPAPQPTSPSGGWRGAAALCDGGLDGGELLVGFAADNFSSLLGWLDHDSGWTGGGAPPAGLDFELRGTGDRPLGNLLEGAAAAIDSARLDDAAAACRPYRAVLIADGGESCGGDAAAAADALLDAGVPVHVVAFAAHDPDASAELDDVAAAGGTVEAIAVDSGAELVAALDQIAGETVLVERCNDNDDDCDGLTDEEFAVGDACDNGLLGACYQTGTYLCSLDGGGVECSFTGVAGPSPESCNGVDDDCDGAVDEEGVCVPGSERCNGVDDDGDEQVDEVFPVGEACSSGVGACRASGAFACRGDELGVTCEPSVPPPAPALLDTTCDGVDEDCDGAIDEEAIDEVVALGALWIDRYEASRPDATATSAGARTHRACSKEGAIPWTGLGREAAAAACAAAGKRLCTEAEWQSACAGEASRVYPYGSVYDPDACNGTDVDPDCTAPNDDLVTATGTPHGCPPLAASACVSAAGVVDLSGNVAEWTATTAGFDAIVRGGAFDSPSPALTCQHSVTRAIETAQPRLGFRCCSDSLPPWIFADGFDTEGMARWSDVRN